MGALPKSTTPDGGVYAYAYDGNNNILSSVANPDKTLRQYQYGNAAFPHTLTGLVDENGNLYASWTYDTLGRAISSQHPGGAELTTVAYQTGSSTVTDANGNARTYSLLTIFGVPKPVALTGRRYRRWAATRSAMTPIVFLPVRPTMTATSRPIRMIHAETSSRAPRPPARRLRALKAWRGLRSSISHCRLRNQTGL